MKHTAERALALFLALLLAIPALAIAEEPEIGLDLNDVLLDIEPEMDPGLILDDLMLEEFPGL